MKERLGGADYRFIAICLALLAGTVWYSAGNFYRAFPEASIDFRVNRAGGLALAQHFLDAQGLRTEGYREASSFTFDDDAKTFLEREAGLETANQLMGTRVRLWRWSYRWFRPQQKEEFKVDITPRGEPAGFEHLIPEDAARPDVDTVQARAIAENFLRTRMGRDPATLEFLEVAETARPHRTDRVFTWKERDFDLHDATNRVSATVLGNEVGGYREFLKIPEQWTRDFERMRSKNQTAQIVDTAFVVVLIAGLIVTLVMRVRRQDVHWRRAAMVGMIAMVLSFCSHLNEFPLHEFGYPTTDSYSSFFSRQMLEGLMAAFGWGGFLFVLTAAAEPLYREAFPSKISLGNLFSLRGLRTKRFFLGAILGLSLTGIFIAYQTAFYITAYRFGAWSPADVPYSDLLNTRFPWLFVLFGGFLPAVSEEFLFRVFAIPFLRKLVRSMAVAVILAGFIWGFGHAGYPQQPFYIRGVEVGIGGVALGLVMLRWGILPTLVWHYSVDAMYSAMLLVRSQSLYFKLSGAASAGILVLPVVVALVAYWKNGGFEPETGLRNSDEAAAPETEPEPAEEPAATDLAYTRLSKSMRITAVAVLAAGLAAPLVPVTRFGDLPRYRIGEAQVQAAADSFMRAQGFDPGAFRHFTAPVARWGDEARDNLVGKYLLQRRSVADVSRLFEQNRPIQVWVTRYFQSLNQEEATVVVHPETGRVIGFSHTFPEDRPGADIPDDAAIPIASAFATSQGWDMSTMVLKDHTSDKRKARRDHTMEWEARPGDPRNVDDARFRLRMEVAGDRVSALRVYWHLPEAYLRERLQQTFLSIAVAVLSFGMVAAFAVWGILLLVQQIRKGAIRWGTVFRIAVPAALLAALSSALQVRLRLQNYDTAMPIETFQAINYVIVVMSAVFAFLVLGAAVALVVSFFPDSTKAWTAAARRLLAGDALFALLAAIGLGLLLRQIAVLLSQQFHADALFSVTSPDLLVTAAPALAALAGSVRTTLLDAAFVALAVLTVKRLPKPWMLIPLGLLCAFILAPVEIHTPGEFVLQYGLGVTAVAAAAWFIGGFARNNYPAYALVLWLMALRGPLGELMGNAVPGAATQGWLLASVAGVGLLWMVWPLATRK